MKKKTVLTLIAILGILFGVGWLLGHDYADKMILARAQANLPDGKILQQDLAKENWTFAPIDPTKLQAYGITQPILTREQAIEMAYKQAPSLQKAKSISGITANLGKLSNSDLQASAQVGEKVDPAFLNPRLVWIVTFAGLDSQSAGPPGFALATSNEFDVVIDAITGEQLMSFVWTR